MRSKFEVGLAFLPLRDVQWDRRITRPRETAIRGAVQPNGTTVRAPIPTCVCHGEATAAKVRSKKVRFFLHTVVVPYKLDPGARSRCQWPSGASQSLPNGSYEPHGHSIYAYCAREAIMSARARTFSRICSTGVVGLLCAYGNKK